MEQDTRSLHPADPRHGAAAAALFAFLLLLVAGWQLARWYEAQLQARLRVEERSEAALQVALEGNVLSSLLNRRFARLQGLVAFAEAVPEVDDFDEQFTRFAAVLYADSVGVRTFTLAPGNEVRYVYPLAGNEPLLGYRPLTDARPEIRAAVHRAITTGEIATNAPIDLRLGGIGLVARAPVHRDDDYWGLAGVVLDLPVLLAEAGLTDPPGNLSYALRDGRGHVFWGAPDLFTQEPVLSAITLPDGTWELAAVPAEGWQAGQQPDLTLFHGAVLAVAALLATIVYLVVNSQERLRRAVAERTAALAESNLRLEERVAERTRELERMYKEAEALALVRERQRIARELHDSASQALYGIALGARTASTLLERGKETEVAEPLDYIHELAEGALAEMRALIFALRPEVLEKDGLVAAIEHQAEVVRTRHRLAVETTLCAEPETDFPTKEALYRMTQEALNNAVKHAGATRVEVEMTCDRALLSVRVRDNGSGFDPHGTFPGHLGLQTMRERVEQLGGTVIWDSAPGRGTSVKAQVPLA